MFKVSSNKQKQLQKRLKIQQMHLFQMQAKRFRWDNTKCPNKLCRHLFNKQLFLYKQMSLFKSKTIIIKQYKPQPI